MSDDPSTFLTVDTTRTGGVVVVPVYREDYYANFNIPQHQLPLEAPGADKTGQLRSVQIMRLVWPARDHLYAFSACDVTDGTPCQPETVTVFFALGHRDPTVRLNCRQPCFDRDHRRTFRLLADGEALDVPSLRYERHGTGPYLEELWAAIPYDTFRKAVQADRLQFEFGRVNLTLRGAEMKPLKAIVAAVEGRTTIAPAPPADG